jgi:hypothetical protein
MLFLNSSMAAHLAKEVELFLAAKSTSNSS